jgi:hypothetical protein
MFLFWSEYMTRMRAVLNSQQGWTTKHHEGVFRIQPEAAYRVVAPLS